MSTDRAPIRAPPIPQTDVVRILAAEGCRQRPQTTQKPEVVSFFVSRGSMLVRQQFGTEMVEARVRFGRFNRGAIGVAPADTSRAACATLTAHS